jgi:hypothetical protein
MTRILTTTALLILWTVSLAGADIFKCQQPDGTIVFTDKTSNADCKLERVEDLPILGVLPDAPQRPSSAPSSGAGVAPQSSENGSKSYESFESEVSALVEQYQSARSYLHRANIVKNKQAARRDLADIKAQMNSLANEIEQSSLSRGEKRGLQEKLAVVSE